MRAVSGRGQRNSEQLLLAFTNILYLLPPPMPLRTLPKYPSHFPFLSHKPCLSCLCKENMLPAPAKQRSRSCFCDCFLFMILVRSLCTGSI